MLAIIGRMQREKAKRFQCSNFGAPLLIYEDAPAPARHPNIYRSSSDPTPLRTTTTQIAEFH